MHHFKVGVIGTGFGGKVDAPIFHSHPGFEVVAIASVSGRNVKDVKNVSGIEKVYTDWREMLDHESLDMVIVASAVYLHREMVLAAFQKGTHVLCEKPMALDAPEAETMIAARNQAGKWGLMNHEFRFLPAHIKVKEMMVDGQLGKVMHVRHAYTHPIYTPLTTKSRGWLGKKEQGGGLLNARGSHMIDSLHWWTNSSFQTLFANLSTHVSEYQDEAGNIEHRTADDAFQLIGTLANGATATMELFSATKKAVHNCRLEIFGDKGTLVMLDDNQVHFAKDNEALEEVTLQPDISPPNELSGPAASHYNCFHHMLNALYETLKTGKKDPHLADFENGLLTQKVLDAIHVSSQKGKRVQV